MTNPENTTNLPALTDAAPDTAPDAAPDTTPETASDSTPSDAPPVKAGLPAVVQSYEDYATDDCLPEDLRFTPVPRATRRPNGLTAERQRAFIATLAECGAVRTAAKIIGCALASLYALRNSEGAESFAQAWDRAVSRGSRRIYDVLVDHSINGIPELIIKDGKVVAERRRFNHRTMMWISSHNQPELAGGAPGLEQHGGTPYALQKLKARWRQEWEEEAEATRAARAAEQEAKDAAFDDAMVSHRMLSMYREKIIEERVARMEGRMVAADFALRQMTLLELVLETAGLTHEMIRETFLTGPGGDLWTSPVSRQLAEERRAAWSEADQFLDEETRFRMTRPDIPLYLPREHDILAPDGDNTYLPSSHMQGGPTLKERERARQHAQRQIAEAQAVWERAGCEETWGE